MARLLAYLSASAGNTFPAIDMLLELQRRGHEVHVRSGASDVDGYAALGLCAAPIDPSIEQIEFDDWRGRSQVDSFMRMVRAYRACANREIPDTQQAIAEVDPDALIIDINCFGAMFVAEASELPWAVYCPYPPPFRSDDLPPHGLGLRPARGPLGRARDLMLKKFGDRQLAPELAQFNDLRAGLGLPAVHKFDDQFLRSDLFIAFTAEPYEYHRSDWPSHVRLVGPGLWEPPADPPEWLETEHRPIVLVTASTAFQLDAKLIATALEGLAGENLAVVATTAAQDPAQFHVPSNAHVEQFLPHAPILARASCVVSHGGQGITQKALAAGVPSCVVPFSRDQFDVARRVEQNDAGVRLHHKRLNRDRLRRALRAAIAKRPGAERISQAFANAGGPAAAALAVEELLGAAADEASPERARSSRPIVN
jgi:MGT family glycosyltransferase